MFGLVFSKRKRVQILNARKILEEVNRFSRSEAFYKELSVPDTMTGRFDLISLIASLVIIRMGQVASKESQSMVQVFFDVMFRQFDHSLRESGVGDLGVPKHMKRMMQGIQGRAHFYEMALVTGLNQKGESLSQEEKLDILNRNLYSAALEAGNPALQACFDVALSISHYIMNLDGQSVLDGDLNLPDYQSLLVENKSVA